VETIASLLSTGEDRAPALSTVDGVVLDWATLRDEVDRLAAQLRAAGIGAGDRVAIVLPNGPEMALTFLAATRAGCAAPLNPAYREEEFRFYLGDLEPSALITREGEAGAAHAAAPRGTMTIAVGGDAASLDLHAGGSRASRKSQPTESDVALVLHTSGTTSRPKIVPLRQRNLARSARNIAASLDLGAADRSLNVMPLFHIHGLMAGLLAPLSAGGSVVATPGFDAFRFHGWIDGRRPTYYTAVPTMHQMVLARAPAPRQTTLRFVRSSSAPLPVPVLEDLQTLFDVPVVEAYGMTEASHQMACNPLPPRPAKPGSAGVATGIDLAVLDEADSPLPPGERGEVAIRGGTVIDGYENNPEANAAAFTSGWFRTGDEGYLDEDGYLFLTGRLKEQINRGGEKISPLEVDDVLLRHPAVAEAVTFAIPHDKLGEEVGAAVVLEDGHETTKQELRAFVSARLAASKVPRVVFVDELPKGATGKLQRIGMADRLGLD
jgi:acyl-CoA synthetase (AMP-forming)/AMP-acid ligase II